MYSTKREKCFSLEIDKQEEAEEAAKETIEEAAEEEECRQTDRKCKEMNKRRKRETIYSKIFHDMLHCFNF